MDRARGKVVGNETRKSELIPDELSLMNSLCDEAEKILLKEVILLEL